MKKDKVALEIRDGNKVLRYSGKKRALIRLFITLHISSLFFSTWYIISGGEEKIGPGIHCLRMHQIKWIVGSRLI